MYGHACNPAETVYQNYNALWKLHVGVIVATLLANKPRENLLPLAQALLLMDLAGVTLFGHHDLNGVMTGTFHFLSMVGQFLAFGISLILDQGTPARTPKQENSLYKKAYLCLISFYFLLWFFLNSDGSDPTEVVVNGTENFSTLAAFQWNWWSVAILQLALLNGWCIRFGDDSELRAVCLSIAALQIVDVVVIVLLREHETLDILIKTNVSFTTMFFLAIAAIMKDGVIGSRVEKTA